MNSGVTFNGGGRAFAISAKNVNAFALLSELGQVTGWGAADLSNNRGNYYYLTGITKISAGYDHCLAVNNKQRIIAWGSNTYGKRDGGINLTGVKEISAGTNHSLVLLENGTVRGWGLNNAAFGNTLTGVKAVSAGHNHSLALFLDGRVTGWGNNSYGQALGGTGLTGVVNISAGVEYSLAVFENGTITGWGMESKISEGINITGVESVSAATYHSLALLRDGTVTGWGFNLYGQALNGNGLTGVTGVSAGEDFSIALLADGSVTGWGNQENTASILTGQSAPITYLDFNGLEIQNTYVFNNQSEWARVSYFGRDITVSKWASGENYTGIFYLPPNSVGKYLFSGAIIDTANYQYYGTGTGLLTILSGMFNSTFTGGNLNVSYDGNPKYFSNYILTDVNNSGAGNICAPIYLNTTNNSFSSTAPSNAGNYLQLFKNSILVNYISGDSIATGNIKINPITSKVIVRNFTSEYTAKPNPIQVIQYPSQIGLSITYNGSTGIPSQTGNYVVSISALNSNYIIDPITGVYSIVGKLLNQSFTVGWGRNISSSTDIYSAATGLQGVQKIVGGTGFSVALMSDNSMVTWGIDNKYGQQDIPYIYNYVKDIFASNNTTFMIDWSGNVTGCGYLFNTLGNGYSGVVPVLTGISGISSSDYYMMALPYDLNKSLTGWGDARLAKFNFASIFNNVTTGITNVCASSLGCIYQIRGQILLSFGQNVNGGQYGQFGWQLQDTYFVQKIACSDYCTLLLYNNNKITGYGLLQDIDGNFQQFSIPDQSIQGKVTDIGLSDGHVLLKLSDYVAPPLPPPPECTGIIYVN